LQQRLWPYLGGIARENKMRALIVGGVEDHVDVLLSIMTWSAPNLKSLCRPWRGLNRPVKAVVPSVETLGYSRDVPPGQTPGHTTSLMQSCTRPRAASGVSESPIMASLRRRFWPTAKTGHSPAWRCRNPCFSAFSVTKPERRVEIGPPRMPLATNAGNEFRSLMQPCTMGQRENSRWYIVG
jgi:hypothetical protein